MPLRLTPTRMTSDCSKSRFSWPSSCASEKLIASMRSLYSLLLLASLKRPTRWLDLTPSSCSSGCTKVPNMSSNMPWHCSSMTLRISMFTRVENTIGRRPSTSAAWLICRMAWCALSTVSIKGSRTWCAFISNCARMALPKVSAVMPVPSETKNTVRWGMVLRLGVEAKRWGGAAPYNARNLAHFAQAACHRTPTTGRTEKKAAANRF